MQQKHLVVVTSNCVKNLKVMMKNLNSGPIFCPFEIDLSLLSVTFELSVRTRFLCAIHHLAVVNIYAKLFENPLRNNIDITETHVWTLTSKCGLHFELTDSVTLAFWPLTSKPIGTIYYPLQYTCERQVRGPWTNEFSSY